MDSKFYINYEKMKELREEFDKKGLFAKFWDSKVPEERKWFFNFISFKRSDKEAVKDEIKKYLDFYDVMLTSVLKLDDAIEKSEKETDDPYIIIRYLYELLDNMDKTARMGLRTTDSKVIYRLHTEFTMKYSHLETMLKTIECAVSRNQLKTLTTLLQDSMQTIFVLKNGMQNIEGLKERMEEKIDVLTIENEKQRKQQQSLIDRNAKLMEEQLILSRKLGVNKN